MCREVAIPRLWNITLTDDFEIISRCKDYLLYIVASITSDNLLLIMLLRKAGPDKSIERILR